MNFTLNLGTWNSIFAVPSCIVDQHIKLAGSAQLKVLLWVLRYAGQEFNIDDIASSLSMHSADVKDALQYWIETNVICINKNIISPSTLNKETKSEGQPQSLNNDNSNKSDLVNDKEIKEQTTKPKPKRLISRPQRPDSVFVANRINGSPEISFLMQEAEVILHRPISNGDAALLVMMHDNDGLPVDVILMLLQYSVSMGKDNMRYIEKVAVEWAEEEIDTIEKAENKIKKLSISKQAWTKIEKLFGIEQRSPTSKEKELANKWINEWNFNEDIIKEAYDRCIESKGKYLSYYIDSILKRWYNSGISTLEQIMEEKLSRKSKTSQKNHYNSSYNLEEYESVSIFD